LARNVKKKLSASSCSFAHFILILSLHYLVKCKSRCLAIYNSEFILGSASLGSEHCCDTKSLKICYILI